MIFSKQFGSMSASDLRRYYLANILSQIQYWWIPSIHKRWLPLEARLSPNKDLKLYLIATKAGPSLPPIKQMICGAVIAAWAELDAVPIVRKKATRLTVPFEVLTTYILEIDFGTWRRRGLINLRA